MSMYEQFTIEEKKELLNEVLKELDKGSPVKDRFQDIVLGCEVIRFPLLLNEKYCGRDLIFVYDFMKTPEELKYGQLTVSYASPYYKLIKNESVKRVIQLELEELVPAFNFNEKKESITDYSCIFTFEDKAILVRNSYVPSRALNLLLSVKRSVYIPLMKLSIIHTDKEIRKYEIRLKEKLEKFNEILPVVDELEKIPFSDLPENLLREISEIYYVKYKTLKGVRTEEKILLGKELLQEARDKNWSGLQLIEKTLRRAYATKRYTLKRKVDNIVINHIDEIYEKAFT